MDSSLFEKTFDSLLKGLAPKSDTKCLHYSTKKFDAHSRALQYHNGEKEFIQLASNVDSQMRSRVSLLNLSKSPLQPILNDVFMRKPKRQIDKSALNDDARTTFVDLFSRMNTNWEQSESKKNAVQLFDIKPEGERDNNITIMPPITDVVIDRGATTRGRRIRLLRATSNNNNTLLTEDAVSPLYKPVRSISTKQYDTKHGGETGSALEKKVSTPILNKEDSLDNSANFNMFKPVQSLNQINASRNSLGGEEKDKEEEMKELERVKKEEEKAKKEAQEEKERKEKEEKENRKREEEKKKMEEMTQKKVDQWMQSMPDFGFLFSNEIVDQRPKI